MKTIPVLGLGGVPPSCTPPASFEGHGLLSRALAPPQERGSRLSEYERRHRMLARYLQKRAGYIHAGTSTVH
jgi:hypothetical protein